MPLGYNQLPYRKQRKSIPRVALRRVGGDRSFERGVRLHPIPRRFARFVFCRRVVRRRRRRWKQESSGRIRRAKALDHAAGTSRRKRETEEAGSRKGCPPRSSIPEVETGREIAARMKPRQTAVVTRREHDPHGSSRHQAKSSPTYCYKTENVVRKRTGQGFLKAP